jgi:outer membrane protein assembly factor BamB
VFSISALFQKCRLYFFSKAEKVNEANTATGAKGRIAMHNLEHKPSQEEPSSLPEQKGAMMTERQQLPRSWRYTIIGGSVLLVFAVIIAGLLTFANQKAKPSPRIVPTPTIGASSIPIPVARETTLPTPVATPMPAPAVSDYKVNTTIADGVAYLSTSDSYTSTSNNAVLALSTSNGALLWHQKIEGSAEQAPLVANGVVYVTSFVGQNGPAHVYALRSSDGSLLWRYDNSIYSYLSLSTSDSNVVYVSSQNGISALLSNNGNTLWHFATKDSDSASPLEVNGIVYYSSFINYGSGTFYALRASDGTPIWHYPGASVFTPIVANGVVYIGLNTGTIAALNASNGHQIWKQALDANQFQSPQFVNGVLYLTTTKIMLPPSAQSTNPLQATTAIDSIFWNTFQNVPAAQTIPQKEGLSSVYAIRVSDGKILWHYTMNNGKNSWTSWLALENGVVYASAITDTSGTQGLGDIYAIQSSNGYVLWHDKLNRSPDDALLTNGIIYLSTSAGSSDGTVYALRAHDGSLLWDYPILGPVFNAPILDDSTVYFGATNGMVYALRADNGRIIWHYLIQVGG